MEQQNIVQIGRQINKLKIAPEMENRGEFFRKKIEEFLRGLISEGKQLGIIEETEGFDARIQIKEGGGNLVILLGGSFLLMTPEEFFTKSRLISAGVEPRNILTRMTNTWSRYPEMYPTVESVISAGRKTLLRARYIDKVTVGAIEQVLRHYSLLADNF